MRFVSDEDKRRAKAAQRKCEDSEAASALAGAASGAAALLVAPVAFVPVAAVAGLAVAGSKFLALRHRRLAEDPPQGDFERPVRLHRRAFEAEAFGATEIERQGVVFVLALLEAGDLMGAFVNAVERAAGASNAKSRQAEQARLAEARRFAGGAAQVLVATQEASAPLAEFIEALQEGFPAYSEWRPKVTLGRPFYDTLPAEALSVLYRAKIRVQELGVEVNDATDRPLLNWAAALREVGSANARLGQALRHWPDSDAE